MITARIECDSINPAGIRLTTFVVQYNRWIHGELLTHRSISRNSASSRAIPIKKMIEAIRQEIAEPEQWGRNQPGMQAGDVLSSLEATRARDVWRKAAEHAIAHAEHLMELGVHKQIANRLLEPFSHITVVATATDWMNFFALRAHPMAQPEFQVLAYRMLDAYLKSTPNPLIWGQWHLPFILPEDRDLRCHSLKEQDKYDQKLLARISAARCARVSYLNHDGIRSIEDDLKLYERLVGQIPRHSSSLEHPAQAIDATQYHGGLVRTSNFHPSWNQLRKTLPNENITQIDLNQVMANKPEWITL